jgi:uncharacterized protein YmfQ (DUF2313 family)
MDRAAWLDHLQSLLPPGAAWSRAPDAALTRLLNVIAGEFARLDALAEAALAEADPRTTSALIAEWEAMAALPDSCSADELTGLVARRAALLQRVTSRGGQSRAYFMELAAALGYTITITEFRPFTVGKSTVGEALTNGAWQSTWQVNAPLTTIRGFTVGQSAVGDPLRSWGNQVLECAIRRANPAHTLVLFKYG